MSVVSHVDSGKLVECGAVCPPPVGDGCWGKACKPIMSGCFVPGAVCPRQWAIAAPGAVCPPQWAMAAPETEGGENRKKKRKKKMQGAAGPPMLGDSLLGCSVSTSVGGCCTFEKKKKKGLGCGGGGSTRQAVLELLAAGLERCVHLRGAMAAPGAVCPP